MVPALEGLPVQYEYIVTKSYVIYINSQITLLSTYYMPDPELDPVEMSASLQSQRLLSSGRDR